MRAPDGIRPLKDGVSEWLQDKLGMSVRRIPCTSSLLCHPLLIIRLSDCHSC